MTCWSPGGTGGGAVTRCPVARSAASRGDSPPRLRALLTLVRVLGGTEQELQSSVRAGIAYTDSRRRSAGRLADLYLVADAGDLGRRSGLFENVGVHLLDGLDQVVEPDRIRHTD
jgi:hypothetical protein